MNISYLLCNPFSIPYDLWLALLTLGHKLCFASCALPHRPQPWVDEFVCFCNDSWSLYLWPQHDLEQEWKEIRLCGDVVLHRQLTSKQIFGTEGSNYGFPDWLIILNNYYVAEPWTSQFFRWWSCRRETQSFQMDSAKSGNDWVALGLWPGNFSQSRPCRVFLQHRKTLGPCLRTRVLGKHPN